MGKKVKIGERGKVNIKWEVMPIDYSRDKASEIVATFAKKYGISKNNVNVEPVFIQKNANGENITLADGIIDDIQDPKFQQQLFKTYIEINEIKDYNLSKILEIDNAVNARINYEAYDKHKRYMLKWLKWSNFMSYGKNNYFDFRTLKGLVLLTSTPANQGGKSTFCLDLFRFLLFGKVTSRQDDWTLAKVFNNYLPEETECSVEGCVEIDGVDYIIKRVVTRPKLDKRTERSKVTQKINYYKLVNDEYIDLDDEENESEATGRDTNKAIKDAIGNEKDFDLMICVDRRNLEGLISLKDTERGRLISRWIGLLPLEEKDKLAREMFNQDVMPKLLTNKYNKEDLAEKIKGFTEENKQSEMNKKKLQAKVEESKKKISDYQSTRDLLLQSKQQIDNSLMKVDVATVEAKIKHVTEEGKRKRAEKESNEIKLKELGDIMFNEEEYKSLEQGCTKLNIELATMREQLKNLKVSIKTLQNGEYCPTCGAKLKNVDNSKAIAEKQAEYDKLAEDGKVKAVALKEMEATKQSLSTKREQYNLRLRLELIIAKNGVDIENLIAQYKENSRLLKDIQANKTAIEKNNQIEIKLNNINVAIKTEENTLNLNQQAIVNEDASITYNNKIIKESNEIIKVLDNEAVLLKNWKIYLEMVGKHGISKLVIRKALPFINGELHRLLTDVCDFDIEIAIDDRNDVEFYIIHDNVKSSLGSGSGFEQTVASLALRSVLSKISTFSKPSFVVFDEILGGVADENYDKIKLLYDKIVKDYSVILQISHLKQLYDMHDKILVVTKENNISRIEAA
jgi:DNA repair exonuclease SbcCD ATPase subunit